MTVEQQRLAAIIYAYDRLRKGVQRLAMTAQEQRSSEPDFVCLSFELLDEVDRPLEILESFDAIGVIDPLDIGHLQGIRERLLHLARDRNTAHLDAVLTDAAWEQVRSDARSFLGRGGLRELDSSEIEHRVSRE